MIKNHQLKFTSGEKRRGHGYTGKVRVPKDPTYRPEKSTTPKKLAKIK